MKRKPRVRMHLEGANLPTVEGLLVSRRRKEYMLAVPRLLIDPQANPAELEAPYMCIPRDRVAFFEIL